MSLPDRAIEPILRSVVMMLVESDSGWRAVLEYDRSFDGKPVCAVRTTIVREQRAHSRQSPGTSTFSLDTAFVEVETAAFSLSRKRQGDCGTEIGGPAAALRMDSGGERADKERMIPTRTSPAAKTLVMRLESQPGWGAGLVTRDLPLHWELFFDHGGERKFVKSLATTLVPVTISPAELVALEIKAFGRHARSEARANGKPRVRASSAVAKPRFGSIDEQIAFFEKLFPGGFTGDVFTTGERGVSGANAKSGRKHAAIALARKELTRERFESSSAEVLFEGAKKVLQATNVVFPMEGPIPFGNIDVEDRAHAIESLKQLLHGDGDYGDRLQSFAGAIRLKGRKGEPKAATWPFATIFAAYLHPKEFVCVKPAVFATQAATLGISADKSQPVTAAGYREFSEVATKTRELLKAAGEKPRDLMDVYSFIWRTHAEKGS